MSSSNQRRILNLASSTVSRGEKALTKLIYCGLFTDLSDLKMRWGAKTDVAVKVRVSHLTLQS